MDAKTKANFINSVAEGEGIPCPQCDALNKPGAKFCTTCGTPIEKPAEPSGGAAFKPVEETNEKPAVSAQEEIKPAAKPAAVSRYKEPESVFAQGLPEWSIEPPQVMVRRR